MPHENNITSHRGHELLTPELWSFRWPYQANVINILEHTSSITVIIAGDNIAIEK